MKKLTAAGVAELVGGELRGDGAVEVSGVASLTRAHAGAVSFLGNPKFREQALAAPAGVLLTGEALPIGGAQVIVGSPYAAFVRVMEYFREREAVEPGVHESAAVAPDAELGAGAYVGPGAVIGPGATVGAGSVIHAGAVIGAGATVGAACVLHPRVVLYPGVKLGDRVIIHAGTVIGSDGFGYVLSGEGHLKKPQAGTVVIGDDVEIGANCAIDRAMLDETVIGSGTKIDNLVHLAHNVRVGERCIILAGSSFGGSVTLGDGVIVSGSVTVKDGVTLGSGAMVVGGSGVADDVAPGDTVMGYPALPFSAAKRVYSRLKQLPELFSRVRRLEKSAPAQSGGDKKKGRAG